MAALRVVEYNEKRLASSIFRKCMEADVDYINIYISMTADGRVGKHTAGLQIVRVRVPTVTVQELPGIKKRIFFCRVLR